VAPNGIRQIYYVRLILTGRRRPNDARKRTHVIEDYFGKTAAAVMSPSPNITRAHASFQSK